MRRWPGRKTWLAVGSANLYRSGVLGVIAFGCSRLSRYRPRRMSMETASCSPPHRIGGGRGGDDVRDRLAGDLDRLRQRLGREREHVGSARKLPLIVDQP